MIAAVVVGLVLMGALGVAGRGRVSQSHQGWSVANRSMSSLTTFFLQAGAIFTSFTFLGMSGVTILGGVAATYLPAYLVIGYIGMFLMGPAIWRLGKKFGYHTNADMLSHQFRSPLLGRVVAVVSVVFFIPIVQVQIVGLGTIVSFATGEPAAGRGSMIVATIIILIFLVLAGLRGVAFAAYFKDVAMVVALVVILGGIMSRYGLLDLSALSSASPSGSSLLVVPGGTQTYGVVWYVSSVVISGLGLGSMSLPEAWPAVLAADSPRSVSKNHVALPLYSLATFLPIFVGFYAESHFDLTADQSNSAILLAARTALPGWLMGAVVVAGLSCAIVPAAHCVLSIATLISSNLVPATTADSTRLRVSQGASSAILLASLALALFKPDLLTTLYLLTYAGLVQLVPGNIMCALGKKWASGLGVLCGLVVGDLFVLIVHFGNIATWGVNEGIIGLGINIVVVALVTLTRGGASRTEDELGPFRGVSDSRLDEIGVPVADKDYA